MKVLLDIQDSKADFFMELLNSVPYIKTKPLTSAKAKLLIELKGSIDEINLAKNGKIKLQSAKDFLNEL